MFGFSSRLGILGMSTAFGSAAFCSRTQGKVKAASPSVAESVEPVSDKKWLWEGVLGAEKDTYWRKLCEGESVQSVRRGRVSYLTTNQYAANSPIEDRFAIRSEMAAKGSNQMLFGVFDGHSGFKTSEFCKNELFDFIEYTKATTPKFDPTDAGNEEFYLLAGLKDADLMKRMSEGRLVPFTKAFQLADDTYLDSCRLGLSGNEMKHGSNGSCAVVCHVDDDWVTTAWVGDCRAVVGRRQMDGDILNEPRSSRWKSVALTADHKISTNAKEKLRLQREHKGETDIVKYDRVKGGLVPTRVFGDGYCKHMDYFLLSTYTYLSDTWKPPYVTAKPELSYYRLQKDDSFIVLATDGLFDALSNDDVVKAVGALVDSGEMKRVNASTYLMKESLRIGGVEALRQREELYMWQNPGDYLRFFPRHKDGVFDIYLGTVMDAPQRVKRYVHDDVTVLVIFLDDAPFEEVTSYASAVEMPKRLEELRAFQSAKQSKL